MSVILPTWDGNQTWLVLGLASLYGAFPVAFAALMPALYAPLLIMGIALLFRGVAFEFRLKASHGKCGWSVLFGLAAMVTALIQGFILSAFVQGFTDDPMQVGLLKVHHVVPFNFFVSCSLVVGYVVLGSTRLVLKTSGRLRLLMYRVATIFSILLFIAIVVVGIWTPFINPFIQNRWFSLSLWPYWVSIPAIMTVALLLFVIGLIKKIDIMPYWAAVVIFLCPYMGFVASVYPYIIPYQTVFYDAASANNSLRFMMVGACVMLPVLTAYTYYSYLVFRGKVDEVIGY